MLWRLHLKSLAVLFGATACAWSEPATLRYSGICDASAAESLDAKHVAVADDEDNSLRVYSTDTGGAPLSVLRLSSFLGARPAGEADLEGAARIGDLIYWISSHGRNATGKVRPSRHVFFATRVKDGAKLEPVGVPYHRFLSDLLEDTRLTGYELRRASSLAPKDSGGLNIEALASGPNGQLWVGFRNPIIHGRALLVSIENPEEVIQGRRARLGDPLLVNLGGLGFRSITQAGDVYYIIAGSPDGSGKSRLFKWQGPAEDPTVVSGVKFGGMNPEALAAIDGEDGQAELLVVSDDGTVKVNGTQCKRLKNPALKSFRALRIPRP